MFAAFIKQEQALPDDPAQLQKTVEKRVFGSIALYNNLVLYR